MKTLDSKKIAIIGGGNAGFAFASQAKQRGNTVSLFDKFPNSIQSVIDKDNVIQIEGNTDLKGKVKLDTVTTDLKEAIDGAKIIICVTPANAHKSVAKDLAPFLKDGQMILLSPGRTGGVLEFRKELNVNNCKADVYCAESQTIPYACRKTDNTVYIYGTKKEIPFAGLPIERTEEFNNILKNTFPIFEPTKDGIMSTSFNNIGMLFHPLPTMMNMGRMESGIPFDYYTEGFSPSICQLIEKMDKERIEVAKAFGITNIPTAVEWLKLNYNAMGNTLYETLQSNESYKGIKAPQFTHPDQKLSLRYVIEDVPCGLVPVACLGEKLGVETPAINLAIQLANSMYDRDFMALGRNLENLGLHDLSREEILSLSEDLDEKKRVNVKDEVGVTTAKERLQQRAFNSSEVLGKPKTNETVQRSLS